MGDPPAAATVATANTKKRPNSEDPDADGNAAKKLLSSNPFHGLKDGDAGNLLEKPKKNRKMKPLRLPDQIPTERKEKCPPIFVHGDPTDLRPELRQLIARGLKCSFRLCVFGVKLMTEGKAHYEHVVKYLNEKCYQYFTHDAPGQKPIKAVLHGLDDLVEDDLKAELEGLGLKPLGIHKIVRHDKSRTYRDQLYLVHFEHGSITLKDLKSYNRINSTVVEWVRYKPKHRDVTQCMNCLRFGHGTRNCAMNARCIRCGEAHGITECERMEEADPKCANCGENHRATFKACKKRAEFVDIRNRASTRSQPNRRTAHTGTDQPAAYRSRSSIPNFPPLQPNQRSRTTAASATPQAPTAPTTSQSTSPPGFCWGQQRNDSAPPPPQEETSLYTAEELLPIFETMAARMRSCKTKYDQVYTLGMLLIQYAY